jgi:hypothetical protein
MKNNRFREVYRLPIPKLEKIDDGIKGEGKCIYRDLGLLEAQKYIQSDIFPEC